MKNHYVISLYGGNHTTGLRIYDLAWVVEIFASHGETQLALSNIQEHSTPSPSPINETSFLWQITFV